MDGDLGAELQAAKRFLWFCRKKTAIFTAILIIFNTFWSHMNNQIAKIQKSFQRIKLLSPLLQVKSKVRLNAHILRLNFLSGLANGV